MGCVESGEVELYAVELNTYGFRYVISVIAFQVVDQR